MKGNDKRKQKESSHSESLAWKPPREGFYTINTDGAWINSAIASGGGVIRKPDGSWYKGFTSKYDAALSPLAAELYAMYDGVAIAESLKITKVEIETDAISLCKMIETAGANPHHELVAAIMDVADLIKMFEVATHILAKYGKEMAVGYTTFYFVPDCAAEVYEKDKNGAGVVVPF